MTSVRRLEKEMIYISVGGISTETGKEMIYISTEAGISTEIGK